MKELEEIAEVFLKGMISSREAAFRIVKLIDTRKAYFKLDEWSKDVSDDFLLTELPHIENLLKTFDPNKANFSTFFYKSISPSAHDYKRKLVSSIAEKESVNCMKALLYEEQDYRYAQNEAAMYVEAACTEDELRRSMARTTKNRRDLISNTIQQKFYHSTEDEKLEDLRRSACLILFLKSSAVVDDSSIRNTSIVTGISEERLFSMIAELKEKIEKKISRREDTSRVRDMAFFLRRKYRLQFLKLDKGGMMQKKMRDLLKTQSVRWRKNNWRLETDMSIAPSNKDIGEVLNVSQRKIARILKRARQKIEEIKMKQ